VLVTINTDASFNDQYKIGAYAYWIVSDGCRIKYAGMLKECTRSVEAELKAIANGLYRLTKSRRVNEIHGIIINTDCTNAIEAIKGERILKDKGCTDAIEYIHTYQRILKEANQIDKPTYSYIDYRHVKAHSKIKDSRSFVNDWCDRQARRLVKQRVNQIKQKK
jgi:ribonuclease HI